VTQIVERPVQERPSHSQRPDGEPLVAAPVTGASPLGRAQAWWRQHPDLGPLLVILSIGILLRLALLYRIPPLFMPGDSQSFLTPAYDLARGLGFDPILKRPLGYPLLLAGVIVALPQVYAFLACAWLWGVRPPLSGYLYVLPAVILAGLMLGALGLLLSSLVEQLENFAGVMNFVIFPVFFASTALYPLKRLGEANAVLAEVARFNPFSHAVELVRFALYGRLDTTALVATVAMTVVAMALAVWRYDSGRILRRQLGAH
jgi:hypothetical protein